MAGRFGDWVKARNDRLDEQLEKMLDVEHGGINESMANLYAATGDAKYLEAAGCSTSACSIRSPPARTNSPACTPTPSSRKSSAAPACTS